MLSLTDSAAVDELWQGLVEQKPNLPEVLRTPQRDALYHLLSGRHVLLNVATGGC